MVGDAQQRVHGTIRFDTRDLSLGGAFLRSDLLFEVGEELSIELEIAAEAPLCTRARVVRVDADHAAPGMGIAFADLSEHDREAVRTWLARL
jgi:c-di-GMP-binding flagellar brake protein YcgR